MAVAQFPGRRGKLSYGETNGNDPGSPRGDAVTCASYKPENEREYLTAELIAAQEKERSFIARELHDDICQKLAMLSLQIEKVARACRRRGHLSLVDQLEQVWQQCSNLTGDVQALSHALHPSVLDNLGLVAAVNSFCREVSEKRGVAVEFIHRNVPDSLPREVALCLFRVAQEALHNATKYSGQKNFEVHLQGNSTEVELEVNDRGVGFDLSTSKNRSGLGLVSMRERVHLLNGTLHIDSNPNAGTRIRVLVPVVTQPRALMSWSQPV